MTDQLKAYPFCGGTATHEVWSNQNYHCIVCGECDFGLDYFPDQQAAFAAWNTRAQAEYGEAVAWLEVEPGVTLEQAAGEHGMLIHSMQVHVGRRQPAKAQEANGLFPLYAHPPRATAAELAAEYTRGRNDGWDACEAKARAQGDGEDPCRDRCQRIHPHCQLTITRDVAPDHHWHWLVTMPDGHVYDISHGQLTFEQALTDVQRRGVMALDAADTIWRRNATLSAQRGEDES